MKKLLILILILVARSAFAATNSGAITFGTGLTLQPASGSSTYTLTLPATAGSTNQFLQTDGSGTTTFAGLPNPTASTLGGIESLAAVTSKWINTISTSGVPSATQPGFSDVSGNISTSQMNSGTGATSSTFWRGDGTWATPAGGTVTSIATTSPISGGTITTTGTISLLTNVDFSFTTAQTYTLAPAANTASTGVLLTDTTAASSGNQQYSPALRFTGQGWKTTATAASQSVDFRKYVVPVQGAANPTAYLTTESAINGGSFGNALNQFSSGALGINTTTDPTAPAINLTGGTVTTSVPVLNATQTWNASGTTFGGLKLNITNTASAAASLLLDLQLGGTSSFKVDKLGVAYIGDGTAGQPVTFIQGVRGTVFLGYGNGGGLIAGANSTYNGNWFHVSQSRNQASLPSGSGIGWQSGTVDADVVNDTGLSRNAAGVVEINNGAAGTYRDLKVRQHYVDATLTASGTTGNQTINKAAGSVRIAAAGTNVTVTDSLCTANSIVLGTIATNDATAVLKNIVASAGSFVITLNAAATAETEIRWVVINQ